MVKFKSPKGDIIEVTEEHANTVLRPQGKYVEVFEEVKVTEESITIPVIKKKSKKKTAKRSK